MTTHAHAPATARWTAGFGNVFARESRRWWSTPRWWVQTLLWTAVLNGLLLAFLWIADQAALSGQAVGVRAVWAQYLPVAVLLSTVGVVVLTQGVMLDERRAGTLEWVLTKPVSRTAFCARQARRTWPADPGRRAHRAVVGPVRAGVSAGHR